NAARITYTWCESRTCVRVSTAGGVPCVNRCLLAAARSDELAPSDQRAAGRSDFGFEGGEIASMAKVLVVTSGKGGVGKTTSTAALGAALAQAGQKDAVVDFDVGLRNLDLVMRAERRAGVDLINVVQALARRMQARLRGH